MFHEIHRHSRRVSSSATTKDADRLWFCVALLPIIVRRVNRLVMIIENQSLSDYTRSRLVFRVHIFILAASRPGSLFKSLGCVAASRSHM